MHKKVAVTVVGWVLVLAGVVLIAIPGPGLLIMLAGLVVLASEYTWAQRFVDPVRVRALRAAEESVASGWRIVATLLGGVWLAALGVLWWMDPQIPRIWVLGPRLPLGGWPTGSGLILSAFIVWGLLIYSIRRFRHRR
ncbi:MAG TPA: PGPGW domain-containing protein [Nocardioidaceae bacterium]|nr:PGPGW domain-containing protein [Nocardioidaceae bacterium]